MSKIKDFFNKIRHNYYGIGKVLVFLVAIALVCWLMPRTGKFKYEYQLSKPWQHETLYAPFDFPIYKDYETLGAETEAARAKVKPIFVFNDDEMVASRNLLFVNFDAKWDAASHFPPVPGRPHGEGEEAAADRRLLCLRAGRLFRLPGRGHERALRERPDQQRRPVLYG